MFGTLLAPVIVGPKKGTADDLDDVVVFPDGEFLTNGWREDGILHS